MSDLQNISIAIAIVFLFTVGIFFYLDIKLHDLTERVDKLEGKHKSTDNKDTEDKHEG
jgi:hypothetical protein